jgi:hypothetical protein
MWTDPVELTGQVERVLAALLTGDGVRAAGVAG